jgi:hypothetical protein
MRLTFARRSTVLLGLVLALLFGVSASEGQVISTGPSIHCHVTDGAFTTCPDSSSEWSDITPLPFGAPVPGAIVYTDQRLAPAADLFLMYDLGQDNLPLGPSQSVDIQFAVLEAGAFEQYLVKCFGNGSEQVFVDGVSLSPPFEGIACGVGYGLSPTTGFSDVFVELEVPLNVVYSPDTPLFWTARAPLPQTPCKPGSCKPGDRNVPASATITDALSSGKTVVAAVPPTGVTPTDFCNQATGEGILLDLVDALVPPTGSYKNRGDYMNKVAKVTQTALGSLVDAGVVTSKQAEDIQACVVSTKTKSPSPIGTVPLTLMAVDPFTNSSSQHRTIVGPDTFSFGSTIVAAAQDGRFFDGGASDIGFATSTNNGTTWTSGVLPGITVFSSPPGPYARVSDPSVAFDARHGVWMVSSLALNASVSGAAVIVSRSTNGGLTWGNPVTTAVALPTEDFDKNWIVCDNTPTSPYYGSCYTQWDDYAAGNRLKVAYSQDGGLTWTPSNVPPLGAVGGQPLVLPNGRVVVVFSNVSQTALSATISTDGGVSFAGVFPISTIAAADDPGTIRSDPLSSAEISGDGRIYVVWADCRYRAGCPNPGSTNDLVYKTSINGTTWNPPSSSSPNRIPIDPIFSTVDHFIPGVAVDRITSGASIHVAVAYYFYPNGNCSAATCQLSVGYVSSANGGSTWSAPIQLAGPMATSFRTRPKDGWSATTSRPRSTRSASLILSSRSQTLPPRAATARSTRRTATRRCTRRCPDCQWGALYPLRPRRAPSAEEAQARIRRRGSPNTR